MEQEIKLLHIEPKDIEHRSMEIISDTIRQEYPERMIPQELLPIILRVIHTTADFEYLDTMTFTDGVVSILSDALRQGAVVVTDTEMARAGINKRRLSQYGGEVRCFMSDPEVAKEAKARGITRAAVSMEHAAHIQKPVIFAIGNAPTALISLYELIEKQQLHPVGIIAVPVGFVNVVEAKELILSLKDIPSIVARGRKGGSNVAAAIVNAMLYQLPEK